MGVKKVLVVDIDETLLNIEPLFFLEGFRKDYPDYKGQFVNFKDIKNKYYMVSRPRVKEFLEAASLNFDLVAFSVVEREITTKKLEILGIKDCFIKVYGKEDLIDKKKSLKTISEDLKVPLNEIIAIDNDPNIFLEKSNVIPVKPFFMGKDNEYEYQEHGDNLLGAINQALNIRQAVKIVPSVN